MSWWSADDVHGIAWGRTSWTNCRAINEFVYVTERHAALTSMSDQTLWNRNSSDTRILFQTPLEIYS